VNLPFKIGQPRFLTRDEVLTLHATSLDAYGGAPGVLSTGMLDASLAMPGQGIGREYAHEFPFGMAAAYGYHLAMNHAFRDGNKRTAFAAMVVFLRLNGWNFDVPDPEAAAMMLEMIVERRDKLWLALRVSERCRPRIAFELRDFFTRTRLADIGKVADSIAASGSESEIRATEAEAYEAIPLLEEIDNAIAIHHARGNEQAIPTLWHQQVFIITLYRLAEDMGYEW
jgi:death-on-curing protein